MKTEQDLKINGAYLSSLYFVCVREMFGGSIVITSNIYIV